MTNSSSNAQCILVVYNSPSVTFDFAAFLRLSSIQQMPSSVLLSVASHRSYSGRIREEANRSIVRKGRGFGNVVLSQLKAR